MTVCILTYVKRFCNILSQRTKNIRSIKSSSPTAERTNDEIHSAELYFFKKGSAEEKFFLPEKKYLQFSVAKDDMLFYSGRILPETTVSIVGRYTDAMKDLTATSFCVPVLDKNSPVAFSIVNDIHWNDVDVRHSGVETTYRQILKKVFIIEGRALIKLIRRSCERCRHLAKQTIEVIMGPVPNSSLTIAPAFYNSQVDLSGPYKAFSHTTKEIEKSIFNERLSLLQWESITAVIANSIDNLPLALGSITSFENMDLMIQIDFEWVGRTNEAQLERWLFAIIQQSY